MEDESKDDADDKAAQTFDKIEKFGVEISEAKVADKKTGYFV
mgnify:FL=1